MTSLPPPEDGQPPPPPLPLPAPQAGTGTARFPHFGVANGIVEADTKVIYIVKDMKVALSEA